MHENFNLSHAISWIQTYDFLSALYFLLSPREPIQKHDQCFWSAMFIQLGTMQQLHVQNFVPNPNRK